jgi:large conductance mechanosensitive channel
VKGFKEFLMRSNVVVDLAVAFVFGLAIVAIINAIVGGLITPLIAAIFGQPDLDSVGNFTINDAHFSIGVILTAIVNFILVAAALYFCIVLPMNKFREMRAKDETAPPTELELLTEIRDALVQRSSGSA